MESSVQLHPVNSMPSKTAEVGSSGIAYDPIDDNFDYQTADLNKLSHEELTKHKQKMDIVFKQNKITQDNPQFIYDKQEEFNPKEDNAWDEEL